MSYRASFAISRNEIRILRRDFELPIFMLGMPVLMMAFLKPVFAQALRSSGFENANGTEQVVPGMAVLFASFFAGYVGYAFIREHVHRTWDRLRASTATPFDIMMGKVAPYLALAMLQLLILLGIGRAFFGLRIEGSLIGTAAIALALACALTAFGVMITALTRSSQQLNLVSSATSVIFAGVGGAIAPLDSMPGWALQIAPLTPTYWAMRGFRAVILEGGSAADAAPMLAMMGLFTVAFTIVTIKRFQFDESKTTWG